MNINNRPALAGQIEGSDMFKINLQSCGNPDYSQDPDAPVSPSRIAQSKTLEGIIKAAKAYRDGWGLGSGNWVNPVVFSGYSAIGYISYNGVFWKSKE